MIFRQRISLVSQVYIYIYIYISYFHHFLLVANFLSTKGVFIGGSPKPQWCFLSSANT